MIIAIALAFGLVALTFMFHYRALLWLGSRATRFRISTQAKVLFIVVTLFLVHIAEIGMYAITYGVSVSVLELGVFRLLVTLSGIRPHAGASYRAPKDKEWQHAQRRYSAAGDWHSATLAAG